MFSHVTTLETTKAYAEAFNARDVVAIGEMLDDNNVIFSRQEQNAIAGKENVLRRIRNLFWRADEQHYSLQVVNAIVDLGKTKARPCLISLRNGVPVAVCILSCKLNGKINSIAILLSGEIVGSARPTEALPGKSEEDTGETPQERRDELLAVTKAYISQFNKRDLASLADLFDEADTVFHRSDQQAIIGRHNIISRIKDLYRRLDAHGQTLHVVNAVIEHDGQADWPCTYGVLDGTPMSVGVLTLRKDGRIGKIDVSLNPEVVAKARPTEEIPEAKPKLDLQKVLEREEWLLNRMKKINKAMKKNGRLPHLVTKQMRVEQQLAKIEYLKKKLG